VRNRPGRPSGEVRRFDLRARQWLPPLRPANEAPAGLAVKYRSEVVEAVLADARRVVVLSYLVEEGAGPGREDRTVGYRLTAFPAGETTPAWTKAYASAGDRRASPGWLWAATKPDFAAAALRHLTRLGPDTLLVCAGAKEDLLALDWLTGQERWKQGRVWEYERSFIGPSVWEHRLGRFGKDAREWEDPRPEAPDQAKPQAPAKPSRRERLAAARQEFDQRVEAAIVAGPEVVALGGEGRPHFSVFVAVAKGPNTPWSGYLAECVVYELDELGEVTGTTTLPRLVEGRLAYPAGGGLVWGCQRQGLVRFSATSRGEAMLGRGGLGSVDRRCRVDWYRELAPPRRKAWLMSDPAGDVACFADQTMIRVIEGGYVEKAGDRAYRFPLAVVDLAIGLHRTLVLTVPFTGNLPLPASNYSRSEAGTLAFGPYQLAVTGLRVEGRVLQVTLGTEGKAVGVDFDLGKWLEPRPASPK
jgi:hypothetical protein